MAERAELNSATFDKALDSTIPVAVDFYADWCGPCRAIAPIIDELAEEYRGKIVFTKLNVDENSEVADRYEIVSIPTLLIFFKGKATKKIVGARKIEDYRSELDQVLSSP